MARKLQVEYPGAVHHAVNRGDRREPIFKDDADRGRFLETLAEVCAKSSWEVLARCLMGNHFHLVVETPQGNLVAGMKWLLGEETDVAKAERVVREELKARRWREADLAKRAKGDVEKVNIAARLREETLVTVAWIAGRLGMGTAGHVNNRPYRWRKGTLG